MILRSGRSANSAPLAYLTKPLAVFEHQTLNLRLRCVSIKRANVLVKFSKIESSEASLYFRGRRVHVNSTLACSDHREVIGSCPRNYSETFSSLRLFLAFADVNIVGSVAHVAAMSERDDPRWKRVARRSNTILIARQNARHCALRRLHVDVSSRLTDYAYACTRRRFVDGRSKLASSFGDCSPNRKSNATCEKCCTVQTVFEIIRNIQNIVPKVSLVL